MTHSRPARVATRARVPRAGTPGSERASAEAFLAIAELAWLHVAELPKSWLIPGHRKSKRLRKLLVAVMSAALETGFRSALTEPELIRSFIAPLGPDNEDVATGLAFLRDWPASRLSKPERQP